MTNPFIKSKPLSLEELLKLSETLQQKAAALELEDLVRSREFRALIEQNDRALSEARERMKHFVRPGK